VSFAYNRYGAFLIVFQYVKRRDGYFYFTAYNLPMDPTAIKEKRETLKEEIIALSEAARDNRKPVALDQQSVGRLSRMDSLQIQAMDKAQETARQKRLVRIDAAIQRLNVGDYGYCAACDEEIGAKRLELDPAVPLCISCAK